MSAAQPTPDDAEFVYDEMAYFAENCTEYGLELPAPVPVERIEVGLSGGGVLSGLRWGTGPLDDCAAVFLHGGAQNAHTWDTVLLALDQELSARSALCFDLPGHGHSSRRDDGWYDPTSNAAAVAEAMDTLGVRDVVLVGMSLGGLSANVVAATRPDLVSNLVIVDVTPGVNPDKASAIHAFIAGPQHFATFGEIFDRTVEFNPTRTPESLRRGILHNAHRVVEGKHAGSWEWNYDRRKLDIDQMPPMDDLWDHVGAVAAPYLLVRGSTSPVVDDEDVAELLRRQPDARVVVVEGAGHSVQGDDPLRLAELLVPLLPPRL
ncbi:MAG: alpha/beta hydrolase [Microthrixaceae bacterium]|nr:alpha/beta hydrolase [Microthrixaceae bacterium]MCO5312783.1 alpha/beta hydrolase [Microthrixaceae bacterium]